MKLGQYGRLIILGGCASLTLSACSDEVSGNVEQAAVRPARVTVIETAWTQSAAERNDKIHTAALKAGEDMSRYGLPELRIYDRQGQLIFHANGKPRGKTDAVLNQAISSKTPIAGPTFEQTLADLETADHRPASTQVPKGKGITIVDYWADWCVPCKVLEKELLAWAAQQPPGSVRIVRAEADLTKLARANGEKIVMIKRDSKGNVVKREVQ